MIEKPIIAVKRHEKTDLLESIIRDTGKGISTTQVYSQISNLSTNEELKDFLAKYFKMSFQDDYSISFFEKLNRYFSNEHIRKTFKSIIYFALLIGFPSIDYVLIKFSEVQKLSNLSNIDDEKFLESFLECTYYYLADRTLRHLLFRKFINDNSMNNASLANHVFIRPGQLPKVEDFIDTNNNLERIDPVVYLNAEEFLASINKYINPLIRESNGLSLIHVSDQNNIIHSLYNLYKEKLERGDNFQYANYEFYLNNISAQI